MEQERVQSQVTESRRIQVGSGERGAKVRTYNFPQDRVTDHRIGLTVHNLPAVLEGDLDALIDAVAVGDQADRLQSAGLQQRSIRGRSRRRLCRHRHDTTDMRAPLPERIAALRAPGLQPLVELASGSPGPLPSPSIPTYGNVSITTLCAF